jgi:hypothetical protein
LNKLVPHPAADAAAVVKLANDKRLASFPRLANLVDTMTAAYLAYDRSQGAPMFVFEFPTAEQAKLLKGHYEKPPKCLQYIKDMRKVSEPRPCPMCGSMHTGTLDHYLPKADFPLFTIFSKNLIPACKCNSKRGTKLLGGQAGERFLHPYYDNCLSERIIRAQFDDLGDVPRVSLELTVPRTHNQYAAIAFHVREIVEKTAIKGFLSDQWSALYRRPSLVVRDFKVNCRTQAEVETALTEELDRRDDYHRSKNNWNSVFVRGLLEPAVLAWLTARLTDPNRADDAPLG